MKRLLLQNDPLCCNSVGNVDLSPVTEAKINTPTTKSDEPEI